MTQIDDAKKIFLMEFNGDVSLRYKSDQCESFLAEQMAHVEKS